MISTMSGLLSRPVLPKRAWSTTFPDLSKSHRIATFLCHWGFVVSRYDEYCLEEILHQQSCDVPLVDHTGDNISARQGSRGSENVRSTLMAISVRSPFRMAMKVCVSYVGERSASDDELAFGTFRFSQLSIDPQFITVLQTARFLSSILCATHALNSRLHCLRPCKSNWLFIGAFKLGWPTHPDWSRLDAGESMLRNLNNFKMPKLIYLEYIRTGPSSAG